MDRLRYTTHDEARAVNIAKHRSFRGGRHSTVMRDVKHAGMKDATVPALLAITFCMVVAAVFGVLWALGLPPFILG